MPAWARAQHNDITLSLLETMPSGGRLELVTDASTIELDLHLTLLQLGGRRARPPGRVRPRGRWRARDRQASRDATLIEIDMSLRRHRVPPGGPDTVCFDGLPAGEKLVEVWLPNAAVVQLLEVRADG